LTGNRGRAGGLNTVGGSTDRLDRQEVAIPPRDGAAIQAEGIRKHFGSAHALDGIDLEIERGMTLGLLGPNGGGKTTFVWSPPSSRNG
jgi:ABC-type glutathione transport system ATPase component